MNPNQDLVIDHEAATLAALEPFSAVEPAILREALAGARLLFFARGAQIINPLVQADRGSVLVLRQGRVLVRDSATCDAQGGEGEPLEPGALMPLDAGLEARRPDEVYLAAEDSFCWSLGGAAAARLLEQPALLRWIAARAWRQRDRLIEVLSNDLEAHQVAAQVKFQPLGSAARRATVTVEPGVPISTAVAAMAEARVGSAVVVEDGRPIGILTESDLVRRVMAPGVACTGPVSQVMTPAPVSLPASATVAEAALAMTTRSIRHLPVVDADGRLAGMISERDLFRLQGAGFGHFAAPIERASSVAELAAAVDNIREVCRGLFLNGMGAEQLTALVSGLNDRVLTTLVGIVEKEVAPGVDYCWLAFGSEGRHEQTFSTDQDNGIIFVPPPGADVQALRERLLDFARRVNQGLDACGFPLCKGNIMAGNPDWCLSVNEWRERFGSWVRSPSPEALLNANIFFDFRPLHGDEALAEDLRDYLFSLTRDNTLFLHMATRNALDVTPPLGTFSRFSTDGGEHGGTVDLKTRGVRLFVDLARILALAHGVRATNTARRLQLGGQKIRRKASHIEADVAAFHFIQTIRMRGQLRREGAASSDPNRIDPYALNEIEQRVLRESLRQAQLLQERLKLDYQA